MTRLLLLALSRVLPNRYGVQLDAGESVEHPLVAMNYILRSIRAGILGASPLFGMSFETHILTQIQCSCLLYGHSRPRTFLGDTRFPQPASQTDFASLVLARKLTPPWGRLSIVGWCSLSVRKGGCPDR